MPTGEPVQDPTVRFDVLVESTVHTTTTLITLTANSGWGEDSAIAASVIQDLVDLVANSDTFRLVLAQQTTMAFAPITPTPEPA